MTDILEPSSDGNNEPQPKTYQASPIKRRRATKVEMEERAEFLISYAEEHAPVTVRGLYYQAEVHGVPGIDKHDSSYAKVQRQVLQLRRTGELAYEHISDATRWMRKPHSHNGSQDAARSLQEKLERFADEECVEVNFETLALEEHQIRCEKLPTREPKRVSPADKKWHHDFACELDAVPPDVLRSWVEMAINVHLPQDQLKILKVAEESEREIMSKLVGDLAR